MSRFLQRAVFAALVFLPLVLPAAAGGVNLRLPSVERRQASGQGALQNFVAISAPTPGSNMSGAINSISGAAFSDKNADPVLVGYKMSTLSRPGAEINNVGLQFLKILAGGGASQPATVHDLLLRKSNGNFELILWDERPVGEATDAVSINLGVSRSGDIYDVVAGTSSQSSFASQTTLALNLTDHPKIIEITSPPVIAADQPADQTVTVGQTATFTATVSGVPTPTCQWTKNGSKISGATNCASHTTPATVSDDNGALFSLTATNSQGTATSRNATLTVNSGVTSATFDQFGLPNPPPAPNNKKAIPAVAFNTSIGANVCGYAGCCAGCTPGSGSQANDINQISYVGVKTLRFGGQNTDMSWAINIAKATGAKYCYLANRGHSTSVDLPSFELANLKTLKAAGVLLCAEGLNEPENEGQQYNGQTCGGPTGQSWQPCAQFMKDLHALIRADSTLNGIALLGISNTGAEIGNYGLQFAWSEGIPSGSGTNRVFPTGTVFSDGAVLHTYLSGRICPNGNCPANLAWDGADPCVNRPAYVFYQDYMNTWWGHYSGIQAPQACDVINTIRVVTESDVQGAFNAGLEYQGVQITNMYINFFMRGIKFTERFGIIEGVFNTPTDQDHPNQQHQGFYAKTLTPYPSANYVHSMSHFLTDTGDVPNPGTVDWSLGSGCGSGGASGDSLCHGLLLQKSPSAAWNPNSYDLLLTYDPGKGGPGISLPVNLGQSPFSRVNVYDLTTVVSPSQNSPVNPTPLVSCQNCGSITIPWSATGVHAGAIPPPLVVEMIP